MELTLEQKDELLRQYDGFLWAMVHRFQRKSAQRYVPGYNEREDLHSECVLVLLKHMNSCETMEDKIMTVKEYAEVITKKYQDLIKR